MSDLSEQIEERLAEPKRVTIDGMTVEGHSLEEMIEADKHLRKDTAAGKSHRGLRFTKLIPPGTV